MIGQDRHYFVYGNTAQGFVDKLPTNLVNIDTVFVFRGRTGAGKACFMPVIAAAVKDAGLTCEYLHCPSAPDTYDGLILPKLRLAVIDGTDLHYTGLTASIPHIRYIDTDAALDGALLCTLEDRITALNQNIESAHEKAFACFGKALSVHDAWETIYIENMDFGKADLLASYTEELLLGGRRMNKRPVQKERFFGASTPAGAMDFIESLTAGISKRYLLKGRPGTGKSTLLRKLAAASAELGLDTDVYSCAFDSGSLDMIIWPELDKCLFDSTAPHLYAPSGPNDEVIDMYAECVRPGTDEKYESALEDITLRYKNNIQLGTAHLSEAKALLDTLVNIYNGAADRDRVKKLCGDLIRRLNGRGV